MGKNDSREIKVHFRALGARRTLCGKEPVGVREAGDNDASQVTCKTCRMHPEFPVKPEKLTVLKSPVVDQVNRLFGKA